MPSGVRLQTIGTNLHHGWQGFLRFSIAVITSPYYLMYKRSTKLPIENILSNPDPQGIKDEVSEWLKRKGREAAYVQIAGAVVFASVSGAISWQGFHQRHWLCAATFYSSILLAVASVVTGAQQTLLVDTLASVKHYRSQRQSYWGTNGGADPAIIFAWQMPLMFLNYSTLLFLIGLSAWVISPILGTWTYNEDAKILIFYTTVLGVTSIVFILCSRVVHSTVEPM